MTDRRYRILGISGIFLIFVFFISGCATAPGKEELEGLLKTTAEGYWQLRLEDKYDETYKIEDSQRLPPFDKYQTLASAIKNVKITSISIKDATVSDDNAKVNLDWTYELPQFPQPLHQIMADYWVYKHGRWRHVFK
jgi:hypothetical protein